MRDHTYGPVFLLALLTALVAAVPASAQTAAPGFSKAFAPATIGPGSVSVLRFTITNAVSTPLSDLAFVDNLPAGVVVATPARVASTCGGTVEAPAGGGSISLTDGTLAASGSCLVRVDVTSATPGTHTNTSGELTSSAGSSGTVSADLTVATDRPGFSKSFTPDVVAFGGRSRLAFRFDNTANVAAAVNLAFTDTLPTGMVVASPSNVGNSCQHSSFTGGVVTAVPGSDVISLGIGGGANAAAVAAGGSCMIVVDVVGNAVGELGNTTGELTSQPQFSNASRSSGRAAAVLTVSANRISLRKSFVDDPAPPGGTVTLRFRIRNLDREFEASGITFTDDLDAVVAGLAAIGLPLADPCGADSELDGTNELTLTGGNLESMAECVFEVTLAVPDGIASGSYLNLTSEVSAVIEDLPVTGDPAADLLFVEPAPILTKSFLGDPVGAGGSVELEFTITNSSTSSAATDIVFEDVFVEELPTASAVPADGNCGPSSTFTYTPLGVSASAQLVVAGAALGPGESCTFSLTLDVAAGAGAGFHLNTTSAVTAVVDGVAVSGNPASDSLEVVAAPTLVKEFVDDPVAPGDTATLRFIITTLDPQSGDTTGDATLITFTDDLEAALSGLVAIGLPAGDVCGAGSTLAGTSVITLTGGNLAEGESCMFDVTVQTPAGAPAGRHTNTTSFLTAQSGGVTVTGNPASDDLRIAGLELTKEFLDDPVIAGGTVTLRFTLANVSPTAAATAITFQDDLDATLSGLTATGLPLNDVCGTDSSLVGSAGNTFLTFQDGSLAAGASCSFDVVLQVPAGAASDTYPNRTSDFSGMIGGQTVAFDNATDELTVSSGLLAITKEFTDDPAAPGGSVTLRFTIDNLSDTDPVSAVAFSDDLDAALPGLAAVGLPISACGGTVSGTAVVSLSGGSLAAGASCSFDVTLAVPGSAVSGTVALNTTSQITGTIGGLGVTGDPASDELRIDALEFTKLFDDPAEAGGTVELTFSITNLGGSTVTELGFTDDLDAVVSGLAATGLPAADVCGAGSQLTGTSLLKLTGGNLPPGGSCDFSVVLAVPAAAAPGDYANLTSDLLQEGGAFAAPAAGDVLTVIEPVDSDGDGVVDGLDVCPGTVIPEGVPTERLGVNRFALVDDDLLFDTTPPRGKGPRASFTTSDTAGCSCEQIIDALGLGAGHTKFGCSLGAMREWVAAVGGAPPGTGADGRPDWCDGGCVDDPEPPRRPIAGPALSVVVEGDGDVSSSRIELPGESRPGVSCAGGSRCATNVPAGSVVVLQARPLGGGSEFAGWGGDCSGTGPVAVVVVDGPKECTATFRAAEE